MRQERITSYAELESRVKFLEQQIALFCKWQMVHRESFQTLHEFLNTQNGTDQPAVIP